MWEIPKQNFFYSWLILSSCVDPLYEKIASLQRSARPPLSPQCSTDSIVYCSLKSEEGTYIASEWKGAKWEGMFCSLLKPAARSAYVHTLSYQSPQATVPEPAHRLLCGLWDHSLPRVFLPLLLQSLWHPRDSVHVWLPAPTFVHPPDAG